MSNYGVRPTVNSSLSGESGNAVPVLETHLFDADLDLYGQSLEVMPVAQLREERKFTSLEALRNQISQDCAVAREVMGKAH